MNEIKQYLILLKYNRPMKFRDFFYSAAMALLCCSLYTCSSPAPESAGPQQPEALLMTVDGPLPADSMGRSLIHEHVFLDWSPVDSIDPAAWDSEAAYAVILPFLQEARRAGVQTILECTPNYLGRHPALLQRLAEATGLYLLTNTGYYGARNDQHIPRHAFEESPEQLARRWIQEYENGISGTSVRPGFIKIGVDGDSILSPIDEKLVRAAALTHLATGLTIVAHTGPDAPARQEVAILQELGVSPQAWVWTHAQNGSSKAHVELARQGAWISLDGLGWIDPADHGGDSSALVSYLDQIEHLRKNDLLHHTLLSHDAGWYTHGEPGGGNTYKPYTLLFELVIPALRRRGFNEEDFRQLLEINPRNAYTIRIRRAAEQLQ